MEQDLQKNQPSITRASVGRSIGSLSDQVAEAVAEQINSQLESYEWVPRRAVVESVHRNMSRGITVLIEGAVPRGIPQRAEAGSTTRERLSQGARWEDIVRAYRLSLTAVHEAFLKEAAKTDLDPEATLDGSSLLWELGDWFINGSAEAFTAWSNEVAGARAAAEAEFVRGLMGDDWRNPQFNVLLRKFELNPDAKYRVFIAPEQFAAESRTIPVVISAVLQNRLVGIILDSSLPENPSAAVAIGVATNLDNLSESAHIAESIWPLVQTKGAGSYCLENIGWRVAVPQHAQLSQVLVERYIRPLEPETAAGRSLVRSLNVFLKHDGNVRLTANDLRLHENSLRYRLNRFTDKTGIQLTSIDHKIGLAWAIESYELHRTRTQFGEFYKIRD